MRRIWEALFQLWAGSWLCCCSWLVYWLRLRISSGGGNAIARYGLIVCLCNCTFFYSSPLALSLPPPPPLLPLPSSLSPPPLLASPLLPLLSSSSSPLPLLCLLFLYSFPLSPVPLTSLYPWPPQSLALTATLLDLDREMSTAIENPTFLPPDAVLGHEPPIYEGKDMGFINPLYSERGMHIKVFGLILEITVLTRLPSKNPSAVFNDPMVHVYIRVTYNGPFSSGGQKWALTGVIHGNMHVIVLSCTHLQKNMYVSM